MPTRNLLLALVLGAALAAGIVLALRSQSPAEPLAATVLPQAVSLPDFRLAATDGREVGPAVFEGRWNLVFFGFTNCPDICPLTLQTLQQARRQLADAGTEPLPRIVLVSVDPGRDTPERLAAYTGAFGEDVLGLTGDVEQIRRLTDVLGVYFNRPDGETDAAGYVVDHSAVVILIGPDARYRAIFSAPHRAETFVHDFPLLARS